MRETIERLRALLVARLGVLEEEIQLAEARYREKDDDSHLVTLENVAVIERQLHDVRRLHENLRTLDVADFDSPAAFRDFVLAQLQELYESRTLMRPSIRMVMECVRNMEAW
ncbi:hypothetical protein HQ560_06980 [bacterium]|nr:hypothetical protein [bacterium]